MIIVQWATGAALLLLGCPALVSEARAAPDCADILPLTGHGPAGGLQMEDLVRLRDIGPPDGSAAGSGLISASPDGRHLAFQIRRADPAANDYCLAMVVMETRPGALPHIVDHGGTLIRYQYNNLWGLAGWPTGSPLEIRPRWSPDGRWIAFLKKQGPHVQVWRARTDGTGSGPVTRSADDVIDFAWKRNGEIIYSTRPGYALQLRAIEREGRSGFLFDDRFWPLARSRPMVRAGLPLMAFHVDAETRQSRSAKPEEAGLVGVGQEAVDAGRPALAVAQGGRRAWITKRDPQRYVSATSLSVTLENGTTATCSVAACDHVIALWLPTEHKGALFLARTGWGNSSLSLFRWDPATGSPRKILETADLLISCEPAGERFFCLREGSARPRHLVEIDLVTGRSYTLFEPNPEVGLRQLGEVQRLHWRNAQGQACFGDLVLPPTHKRGDKHPLIVVQYQSRGFLRGGTGDEYPIFPLAARGYAVLSVQRPPEIGGLGDAKDQESFERINITNWADRESVLSALLEGVRLVESKNVIDQSRIGLTGLSDGVSTVMHALIKTRMFKAVSISQCCDDPKVQTNYVGSQFSEFLEHAGYPPPGENRSEFWTSHSLAVNAASVSAPILIQVSEDEYRTALEAFSALRHNGTPVEMYVFPGEHHVKWQPAHRLAVYERNLAWFDFWLRDIEDRSPERSTEMARWTAMKAAVAAPRGSY